ncbi:MAG: hypothetical protein AVDCRST_MAG77-5520, partial [uncultured Chloroflexi bacterium]
ARQGTGGFQERRADDPGWVGERHLRAAAVPWRRRAEPAPGELQHPTNRSWTNPRYRFRCRKDYNGLQRTTRTPPAAPGDRPATL